MEFEDNMTPDELDAIDARIAAATEGPWYAEPHGLPAHRSRPYELSGPEYMSTSWETAGALDEFVCWKAEDAVFVAHARADLPALVMALREAWAERDRYREQLQEIAERG